MTCGIYYYWDNEKDILVYIGKSINIEKRHLGHLCPSCKDSQPFNRALQKNPQRYDFGLLIECDKKDLNYYEIQCISMYNPLLNFTKGGDGCSGEDSPRWGSSIIEKFCGLNFIIKCNKQNMTQNEVANIIGVSTKALIDYINRRQYNWIDKNTKGTNNKLYGVQKTDKQKENISKTLSKNNNTSGYYRVDKQPCKTCSKGFIYRYRYYKNEKHKAIQSVSIKKLKEKVLKNNLEWIEYGDDTNG